MWIVHQLPNTPGGHKKHKSKFHKSALTDHTIQGNHVINWEGAKVIDKEAHHRRRLVKESMWIRTTTHPINRDDGAYELTHH